MTKTARSKAKKHEVIVNDSAKLHATFEPGDVAHQGDVIFVGIPHLPKSAKPRSDRQLADGNTQGSRHIAERGDVFDADWREVAAAIKSVTGTDIAEAYIGPVFVSPESPTANDIEHPEHGAQGFPAGTICAVVYQRNLDSEEREMRVQD